MKKKLPAFLLMLAVPLSIVAYVKTAAASGSEFLGVIAAMGLYILVFFLLALFFNSRNGDGEDGPAVSAFDELEETRKLAAQLGKVADEAEEQKKKEAAQKK